MNASSVECVLEVLLGAGYERLPKPLTVAGSTFDFDAAVKGTGTSHDLIVLATSQTPPRHLVRLVSALSRTLDQVDSSRPVSLVFVGAPLDVEIRSNLEQHSRVLTVGTETPTHDEVRRAIAILLPLDLPSEQSIGRPPLAVVAEKLGEAISPEQRRFLEAAEVGPEQVTDWLRSYVDAAANGESHGEGAPAP